MVPTQQHAATMWSFFLPTGQAPGSKGSQLSGPRPSTHPKLSGSARARNEPVHPSLHGLVAFT
eukprot:4626159-Alexandrium_andersonii.AAC.1